MLNMRKAYYIINEKTYPYSVDKVVKKEKVKKTMYIVLFLIAVIAFTASKILNIFISCEYIFTICDVLSNLGYGIFASTFVALLIEIRDVRTKNEEFTNRYVQIMKKFLRDYISMMDFCREQADIIGKTFKPGKTTWSECKNIIDQWSDKSKINKTISINQDEYCNCNVDDSDQNTGNLKSAITAVINDIDSIFQAGPLVVINGVDDISLDRMERIKLQLSDFLNNVPSSPEDLYPTICSIIYEQCKSWFLLKGLEDEIFINALGYCIELSENKMHTLFRER